MTTFETKICRKCFTSIDARARKCPACHSLLGSGALFAPALAILAVGTAIALFAALLAILERSRSGQPEDRSADISIVDSTLFMGPPEFPQAGAEGLCPIVIGRLKNNGTHDLDAIGLQVHALNADEELIDVYEVYVHGPFKPGEEYAFKLTGDLIHLPKADYAGHKVIVRNAYEQ